jgi:uncharacterized membrane protein SpoIIM required for sporulation
MVLESLTNPFKAEQNPKSLILIGFVYTIVALILSSYIFKEQASIVFITLVVMASVPLMFGIIKREEKKEFTQSSEIGLLKEHFKALKAFMMLFIGITFGVVFWFLVIPASLSGVIFNTQLNTLGGLGHDVTGEITADAVNSMSQFTKIFFNNVKVLIFCIVFSFIFGSGAIFILTWNASVLGVAIANLIKSNFAIVAHHVGFQQVASYSCIVFFGLIRYALHGIPEILAYFVGALAGGIISFSIIKKDFKGKRMEQVILDSADLLFIAIGLVFLAAVLEVWVTPILFPHSSSFFFCTG